MSWTKKAYCTYLLANRKNGTVYVGVSGNLSKRMLEHKNGTNEGFSKKYSLKKLVYFESFEVVENAIKREKQLKAGKRSTKIQLIEKDRLIKLRLPLLFSFILFNSEFLPMIFWFFSSKYEFLKIFRGFKDIHIALLYLD